MAKKELTRKEFEKIKRRDHHTMKCYIEKIWQTGYDAGAREETAGPTRDKMPAIDRIRDEIGKIKGIGEKKQQAVIDAIITIWEQEGSRC